MPALLATFAQRAADLQWVLQHIALIAGVSSGCSCTSAVSAMAAVCSQSVPFWLMFAWHSFGSAVTSVSFPLQSGHRQSRSVGRSGWLRPGVSVAGGTAAIFVSVVSFSFPFGSTLVFLWIPFGFPLVSFWFPVGFLWLPLRFPKIFLRLSQVFLLFSIGFLQVFLRFSIVFLRFPWVFSCFPAVSLRFSYGFPTVFLWFS